MNVAAASSRRSGTHLPTRHCSSMPFRSLYPHHETIARPSIGDAISYSLASCRCVTNAPIMCQMQATHRPDVRPNLRLQILFGGRVVDQPPRAHQDVEDTTPTIRDANDNDECLPGPPPPSIPTAPLPLHRQLAPSVHFSEGCRVTRPLEQGGQQGAERRTAGYISSRGVPTPS